MGYIFSKCKELTNVEMINWDFSNVIEMNNMFDECVKLEKLFNFPKNKTLNVTNTSFMFYQCQNLKELPTEFEFNHKSRINMSFMFYNCSDKLKGEASKKLNIKKFLGADKYEMFGSDGKCIII